MQNYQATGKPDSARSRQDYRENDGHLPSNPPSPFKVPELAETEAPSSAKVTVLRDHSQPGCGCQEDLDADAKKELDWWITSMASHNGRNILTQEPDLMMESDASQLGWGAVCEGVRTGGLWSPVERLAHINCLELTAAMFAVKAFSKDKDGSHIQLKLDNRTAVAYVNHMGDLFSSIKRCSHPALDMVPRERDNIVSRASTGSRQLHSRFGIPVNPLFSGMAAPQGHICRPDARSISVRCGPVYITSESSTTPVYQLETRPLSYRDRCSEDAMDQVEGLCVSSVCLDQQGPQEDSRGRINDSPDSPGLGVPAMVSSSAGYAGRLSNPVTDSQRPADRPIQPTSPFNNGGPTSVSRLDTVRQGYAAEGVSSEAAQLLLSGWSKGTNTAYQSAWKRWVSWCITRKVDPLSCSVHPFIDFLAGLFSEGLQYRSINTIRSAVSMTHKQVDGVPLGQHPLVSRLFKGMYNARPPQPRYRGTWDVDIVTRYLSSFGDNTRLSLEQLSYKLAILMALVGASRVSELQALDLRFRIYRPEGILFELPSLGKKRTVGAPPKQIIFEAFPLDKNLCGGVFTMLRGQNQAVSTQCSGATKSTVPFLRSAQ